MEEIEIKILEIDSEKIKKVIIKNKGEKIKKVLQINQIYENKYTNEKQNLARIRQEGDKTWITIKSSPEIRKGHKVRKEYEIQVPNVKIAEQIFLNLGLKKIREGECKREYFKLKGCSVEIIEMPQIPPYIEIEGDEKNIKEVANLLGYSEKDYFSGGIFDVYPPKNLKFN